MNGTAGGVLVEGRGSFPENDQPSAFWEGRDLEIRKLQHIGFVSYRWDEQGLRYVPVK